MVTYQFEIDDDDWQDWKETVPRTKSLDERLRELIEADTHGRVEEPGSDGGDQPTDADLVPDPADADTLTSPAEDPDAFVSPGPAFESEQVPENRRRKPTDDTEGFMPPVVALEFDKQATDKRVMVVEEWLEHVRDDGRVQKSDFESWYTDEHADRTGYEPGGFWDFFVKPAMRQVEGIDQPNSRTYVWVGRE
jgi:hypothetical protein